MKKIMQTFLFIIMMLVYIYPANALTEFSIDSWTTSGGYGNLSRVNDKVINIKGNDSASDGMYVGPFSKASTAKLVDGITEETYIELGLDKMKTGEYFEVSLALKDSSNTYVSEAVVMTQKVDDNTIKLSAGWADNVIATISKEGLYTYQWKIFTQGEKTYVNFSLLDGKTVVGTTGNIDMDSSKLTTNDTKNPIAKQSDVCVKYLWFCNVNVQNGINVHISLPEVKPTFDGLLANSNSENLSSVLHNS